MDHFVQGAGGLTSVDVEVVYEEGLDRAVFTGRIPLVKGGQPAARAVVAKAPGVLAGTPAAPATT